MRRACRMRGGGDRRHSDAEAENKRGNNLFHDFFSIVRAPQGSFPYLVAHEGENRAGGAINLNLTPRFCAFETSRVRLT